MTIIINPYAVQPVAGGDPFWANVVSLLHLDGTNGSTTITDETGRAWTAQGNASISTAQARFNQSLALDGTGDYIQSADSADFDFGSGDFTIECFARRSVSADQIIMGQWGVTVANRSWLMYVSAGNTLTFAGHTTGGFSHTDGQLTSTGVWYHVMACRSGGTLYLGVNGIVASTAVSGALQNSPSPVQIGIYDGATLPFNGFIDEVRITKGVARYTANFTPPSAPFPNFA